MFPPEGTHPRTRGVGAALSLRPLLPLKTLLLLAAASPGRIYGLGFVVPKESRRSSATLFAAAPSDAAWRVVPPARFESTLEFPSYTQITRLFPSEALESEAFAVPLGGVGGTPRFRVLLYPSGGYVPAGGGSPDGRVGVYLKYLGDDSGVDVSAKDRSFRYYDVTFSLRLVGMQKTGPRFDLEWRAGNRFVPSERSSLNGSGQVNDFGSALLQTEMLPNFLGVGGDNPGREPVRVAVEVSVHGTGVMGGSGAAGEGGWWRAVPEAMRLKDPREPGRASPPQGEPLRVGNVIVPLLAIKESQRMDRRLGTLISSFFSSTVVGGKASGVPSFMERREDMFRKGVYPGVEYRILRILEGNDGEEAERGEKEEEDLFFDRPGVDYEVKPIYPLVASMERQWPARISEKDITKMITPLQYNVLTAVGAFSSAASILGGFFVVSLAISLFFIPSKSMDPTLRVGDVLLVEKISPRLPLNKYKVGDVVMFRPPPALRDIVARNGGRLTDRDLFVKRVSAVPGDVVKVDEAGGVVINGRKATGRDLCDAEPLGLIRRYVQAGESVVEKG
eukprot:CAMPEP_0194305994 /NCGR_PEP_ID=MMETSP0171-20130528/3286_1 /TAXON_ID=218684 /ORGANISM="Corethron pennatum, Strain L29A3" /LENGTH=561 /DNA_ID=CAMNT_0039057673 /DNA_START=1 /DNA_END=1682 /DNA_ORIENTATION=-